MYDIFKDLASFLKEKSVTTDNWVFRLHYQFTSTVLIAFSVIVITDQFFGNPINCMTTLSYEHGIPEDVINNFCWIHATYTLPKAYDIPVGEGYDVAHPGVDKRVEGDDVIYHAYYQWVSLFLFMQAVMFYAPRYLWLRKDVKKSVAEVVTRDEPGMAQYLSDSRGTHGWNAIVYVLCEALNFVNVVGQIFLTNRFLGEEFTTYGLEVIEFAATNQGNRTDPMVKIFPRVTKCTFRQYGPGGSIQNHDTLCVLPINVINEKIFIFLWFWFVLLSAITCGMLIYRANVLIFEWVRATELSFGLTRKVHDTVKLVVGRCSIGDWFMLRLLKANLTPMQFTKLIEECQALKGK